jgi:hypothetical protein
MISQTDIYVISAAPSLLTSLVGDATDIGFLAYFCLQTIAVYALTFDRLSNRNWDRFIVRGLYNIVSAFILLSGEFVANSTLLWLAIIAASYYIAKCSPYLSNNPLKDQANIGQCKLYPCPWAQGNNPLFVNCPPPPLVKCPPPAKVPKCPPPPKSPRRRVIPPPNYSPPPVVENPWPARIGRVCIAVGSFLGSAAVAMAITKMKDAFDFERKMDKLNDLRKMYASSQSIPDRPSPCPPRHNNFSHRVYNPEPIYTPEPCSPPATEKQLSDEACAFIEEVKEIMSAVFVNKYQEAVDMIVAKAKADPMTWMLATKIVSEVRQFVGDNRALAWDLLWPSGVPRISEELVREKLVVFVNMVASQTGLPPEMTALILKELGQTNAVIEKPTVAVAKPAEPPTQVEKPIEAASMPAVQVEKPIAKIAETASELPKADCPVCPAVGIQNNTVHLSDSEAEDKKEIDQFEQLPSNN